MIRLVLLMDLLNRGYCSAKLSKIGPTKKNPFSYRVSSLILSRQRRKIEVRFEIKCSSLKMTNEIWFHYWLQFISRCFFIMLMFQSVHFFVSIRESSHWLFGLHSMHLVCFICWFPVNCLFSLEIVKMCLISLPFYDAKKNVSNKEFIFKKKGR